ncbi:MAG: hypothetical protein JNM34_11815, partial [Chthonomonadaceae bacterium]|nr:hypothetical protein [Chthonomonadaceae bacterium]
MIWLLGLSPTPLVVDYDPFMGLQVKIQGAPFIVGSTFSYVDAKTGQTVYASRWMPKSVSRLSDGTIQVRYSGAN